MNREVCMLYYTITLWWPHELILLDITPLKVFMVDHCDKYKGRWARGHYNTRNILLKTQTNLDSVIMNSLKMEKERYSNEHHYGWVDQAVCNTKFARHVYKEWNPRPFDLEFMPYPLGHMLLHREHIKFFTHYTATNDWTNKKVMFYPFVSDFRICY